MYNFIEKDQKIHYCILVVFILFPNIQGETFSNISQQFRPKREETCSQYQFRCKSDNKCIDRFLICDGVRDCADGCDETVQLCSGIKSAPRSCTLPPTSPDKNFTVQCPDNVKCNHTGKKVPKYTEVSFKCNPGYQYDGPEPFVSICSSVAWLPPIANCNKICKKLKPKNVDLVCQRKGTDVDCDDTLVAGTTVRPSCQQFYRKEYPVHYRDITCQADGEWTNPLFSCTPECGKPYANVTKLIAFGTPEKYGDSPWNVAIYDISDKDKPLICSGTIISPQLIISAAHCFFDEIYQAPLKSDRYEIAVSKVSRNYTTKDNGLTKYYKIRHILFSNIGYSGASTNYASDIVIIWLVEKISLSRGVLPACIPWSDSNRFNPGQNTSGKLVGWGRDEEENLSEILLSANLPYISYPKCIKTVNADFQEVLSIDKFCAGSEKGAGIRQGDSGAGLLFRDSTTGLYNLRGVASVKDPTAETNIGAFTDVAQYIDWIDKIKNQVENEALNRDTNTLTNATVTTRTIIPNVTQCTLPAITPDKTYTLHCPDEYNCGKLGKKVMEYTALSLRCNPGYSIYQDIQVPRINNDTIISVCVGGDWSNLIKCKKICYDLSSLDLDLTCSKYFLGPNLPCTNILLENAVVYPKCKPHYYINYPVSYRRITCQKDGSWNKEFFQCSPACGRSKSSFVNLIVQGKRESPKDAPWHVAIYSNETSKDPRYICGGTLISAELVVSAAHCFLDPYLKKLGAELFTIMVGKATADFNNMDFHTTRKLSVKSIYFADIFFEGEKSRYQSDIAILLLSDKITYSEDVLPACISLNETSRFVPKGKVTYGKLSGFGATEHEEVSSVLLTANLSYIDIEDCKRRVSEDFKHTISFDKFCAGNATGSGARVGDSGGGLIFLNEADGFFYLRGVVSNREIGESSIATFTDISLHMEWLKKVMDDVEKLALREDTRITVKSET